MKNKSKPIVGSANPSTIIGHFEGECADSTITNLNGLDITREVWETVFASDDYKKALKLGHYIGFLGHPEDPNCMDFEHACIVMTEGHIDDSGKIYGKFNLIDTPVGRIVKAFIDAGVKFGISVRGAGDIVGSSVDPDTFVFRGFDLVTFPAYPDSIPTFYEVAASTDLTKRAKYKAVCSAVTANMQSISSASTIDVIQSQFAPQSDEYKALEARKSEICDAEDNLDDIMAEKLECMTRLYLEQVEANRKLVAQKDAINQQLKSIKSNYDRKVKSLQRITSAQISDLQAAADRYESKYRTVVSANTKLKSEVEATTSSNLKYKQKIESANRQLRNKDSVISGLQTKLDETVINASTDNTRASNLDAANKKLRSEVKAAHKLIAEYQDAYADLYAGAVGTRVDSMSISSNTSVEELRRILGSTSTANMSALTSVDPEVLDIADDIELDSDDMVTL